MNSYKLYNKAIEAFKSGDESLFNASARNWIEGSKDAPFESLDAIDLFTLAKQYCAIWRSEAINSRVSKRRMIECVRKIAEMDLPNPYQDVEEPEEIPVEEPVKEEKEPVKEEKERVHILGVVPEGKTIEETEESKSFFSKRKKR